MYYKLSKFEAKNATDSTSCLVYWTACSAKLLVLKDNDNVEVKNSTEVCVD